MSKEKECKHEIRIGNECIKCEIWDWGKKEGRKEAFEKAYYKGWEDCWYVLEKGISELLEKEEGLELDLSEINQKEMAKIMFKSHKDKIEKELSNGK